MTDYETLLAARRLLATVEAGRAASLSLAAAYLPLRSAALLRETFADQGMEAAMWPEAAVERRLAIERLRRASPVMSADARDVDPISSLVAEHFSGVSREAPIPGPVGRVAMLRGGARSLPPPIAPAGRSLPPSGPVVVPPAPAPIPSAAGPAEEEDLGDALEPTGSAPFRSLPPPSAGRLSLPPPLAPSLRSLAPSAVDVVSPPAPVASGRASIAPRPLVAMSGPPSLRPPAEPTAAPTASLAPRVAIGAPRPAPASLPPSPLAWNPQARVAAEPVAARAEDAAPPAPAAVEPVAAEALAVEPPVAEPVAVEALPVEALEAEPVAVEALAVESPVAEPVAAEAPAVEAIEAEPVAAEAPAVEAIEAEPVAAPAVEPAGADAVAAEAIEAAGPDAGEFDLSGGAEAEPVRARASESSVEGVRIGRPARRLVSADMLAGLPRSEPKPGGVSGLAARLGALARQPDASADPKPNTQVTDRRRDERIARRIAVGQGRDAEADGSAPEPEDARPAIARRLSARGAHAPASLFEPSAAHEQAEDAHDEVTPISPDLPLIGEDALLAAEPEPDALPDAGEMRLVPPWSDAEPAVPPPPGAALRSLAASLGNSGRRAVDALDRVRRSEPSPSLSPLSPPLSPPQTLVVVPDAAPLEGPYVTLETPVVKEVAPRPSTAAIDVRAAGKPANPDDTIALPPRDGPQEDASDDDSAEGMRVHFEVAAPARDVPIAAPGSQRLSFDDDDLTVVQRVDEDAGKTGAVVVDHNARRQADNNKLHFFLETARQHVDRGEYQKAIQAFTDALDINLSHSEAYIGRGRCHMELGDYTSAMSDFRRAEDLQPKHPDPQVAMGDLYFARKEYKRAIEFYDQAVELDGAHAMARCRRGISHYYRKNYRQAFQDLQRANALDPEIPNIKKYVQMALKKMEKAE